MIHRGIWAPEVILERLRAHPDFDSYFLNDDTPSDVSSGTQSQEQVLDGKCIRIGRQDNRIPFSLALKGDRPDRVCVFLECFYDLACVERWSARMCAYESMLYEYQLMATHLAAEHLDTPAPCQPILPGQTFEDFRTQFSAFHNITDLSLDDQCVLIQIRPNTCHLLTNLKPCDRRKAFGITPLNAPSPAPGRRLVGSHNGYRQSTVARFRALAMSLRYIRRNEYLRTEDWIWAVPAQCTAVI
ncbi:unnamed protein product [Dibothriocephalus latus]|uniref:Uncharacterized protein n=1 Tax=Dibothriocephalus latus TaxID=60516 RepID=A0A3P7N193_DIBLA|nr:unnamed protein product [Dibothriocephalus latus]